MKRLLLAAAVAVCGAWQSLAAQDYPSKPIRMVIPNSPGGALDVAARLTQPRMMELLGQSIVLDYRVAAGGVVGLAVDLRVSTSTPWRATLPTLIFLPER